MKYSRDEVEGLEVSVEGLEEHHKDVELAEKISKESDFLEEQYEEWKRKRDSILSGKVTRLKRKELEREERKFKKKRAEIAMKMEFLLIKNEKEIIKEVKNRG